MPPVRARLAALILMVSVLAPSRTVRAQEASDTTAANSASKISQQFWLSFGLGQGSVKGLDGTPASFVFRANLSSGPMLFTYRGSTIGLDNGVRDDALLVGVRTREHRAFGAAAIGLVSVRPFHNCDCTDPESYEARALGLAYDVTAHANVRVVGFGFSLSGVAGPSRVSYLTFTTSLEFGWFGP